MVDGSVTAAVVTTVGCGSPSIVDAGAPVVDGAVVSETVDSDGTARGVVVDGALVVVTASGSDVAGASDTVCVPLPNSAAAIAPPIPRMSTAAAPTKTAEPRFAARPMARGNPPSLPKS